MHTLSGHEDEVRAVAMTPNGRCAFSASEDCTLKVWDLETGHETHTLSGHEDHVCAVAVSPDGRRAVSVSEDRALKVWDLETWQVLAAIILEGGVQCVALAPDGETLVAGDGAGNVYCLRYVEPKQVPGT